MPTGASSFSEGLRMGAEVFHTLKGLLKKGGHNTNVGDEGASLRTCPRPRPRSTSSCRRSRRRLQARGDMHLALDCAATRRVLQGWRLRLPWRRGEAPIAKQVEYLAKLVGAYPIVSIEDGMSEDDWEGWKMLTDAVGREVPARRRRPLRHHVDRLSRGINGRLRQRHPRQGQPDRLADRDAGGGRDGASRGLPCPSCRHRSGETEDNTIADLAVATNCGQIKTGSLARSDRTAKYNQLLRIEQQLGDQALYAGKGALKALGVRTASCHPLRLLMLGVAAGRLSKHAKRSCLFETPLRGLLGLRTVGETARRKSSHRDPTPPPIPSRPRACAGWRSSRCSAASRSTA